MSEHSGSRLLAFDLELRRRAAAPGGSLALLADGLTAELAPLLQRALPIPERKARLTRVGGRCPTHGDLLEFDPYAPHVHHCVRCGRDYTGAEHDDWWAMGAQLWTVERAVHAAVLFLLRGDQEHAALGARILSELTDRYESWPNQDNVLGPSRPFFSTYLESIWLLNACHALDLLETANAPGIEPLARRVKRGLIARSAGLIMGFPEGASNRQVWNEVAILSAMSVMDQDEAFDRRLDGDGGLWSLMADGLLDDGTWYEGENYHLFAHRGLWYGAEMMRARTARGHVDCELPPELDARYAAGFVTPFLGVLPDDTFPSRRDSKYAVSIRQWRIAEWCELGFAHSGDIRLAGVLSRLYARDPASPDAGASSGETAAFTTERARSTADAERSAPATPLSRASLGWRALLMADIDAPPPATWESASMVLSAQGLAVIRRDEGRTYVALEGGHTGGDHGHPDRLSLTLQTGAHRWLDDPGTGSYVDRTLHWYRSTLAHAAPLVDGASQQRRPSTLLAFEDRGGAGWVSKRVEGLAPAVCMIRTVVVGDGYLVDLLEWTSERERHVTLPIAGTASVREGESAFASAWSAARLHGAGGLEDGFDWVERAESRDVAPGGMLVLDGASHTGSDSDSACLWYAVPAAEAAATLFRGTVPGPPGCGAVQRHWLTARGTSGRVVGVWSWAAGRKDAGVASVAFGEADQPLVTVTTRDGTRAEHRRAQHGWHIDLIAGSARSSIDLEELVPDASRSGIDTTNVGSHGGNDPDTPNDEFDVAPQDGMFADYDVPLVDPAGLAEPPDADPGGPIDDALMLPLGSGHYLRTEQSWTEAGEPTAMLQLARTEEYFIVDVDAATGPVVAPEPSADGTMQNPLDNERADVNADGVQWYLGRPDEGRWSASGLCVPVSTAHDSTRPRTHRLSGGGEMEPACSWTPTEDGWAMRLVWRVASLPVDDDGCIAFDLVINERPAERERRRGQLALSGGGTFAYLRGDRQDPAKAVVVAVT